MKLRSLLLILVMFLASTQIFPQPNYPTAYSFNTNFTEKLADSKKADWWSAGTFGDFQIQKGVTINSWTYDIYIEASNFASFSYKEKVLSFSLLPLHISLKTLGTLFAPPFILAKFEERPVWAKCFYEARRETFLFYNFFT